jgi:hypothetical protein
MEGCRDGDKKYTRRCPCDIQNQIGGYRTEQEEREPSEKEAQAKAGLSAKGIHEAAQKITTHKGPEGLYDSEAVTFDKRETGIGKKRRQPGGKSVQGEHAE